MKRVVRGQYISKEKQLQAKELRQNMTPAERVLWQELRAKKLDSFRFRRQQIIGQFIVDFYCHAVRLIVEVDGNIHNHQVDADTERERILRMQHFHILRVTNEDVLENLPRTPDRIRGVCRTLAQT